MYFIHSKKIANELVRLGNDIIGTRDNYKNPRFTIFVFEKTDKLIADLTLLSKK